MVCSAAARYGYLDVIKGACAMGCPWALDGTYREALRGGDEETMRWMREEFPCGEYDEDADEYNGTSQYSDES